MKNIDVRVFDGYEYELYQLELSSVKKRLNTEALNAINKGKANLILDACNVVVVNNVPQGGMNDYGPSYGSVYMDYAGIVSAAPWSVTTQALLYDYYGKTVEGLFYTVSVQGGKGISKVTGTGVYCYGTLASINATLQKGYNFSGWTGSSKQSKQKYDFYVNGNYSWFANAKKKTLTITYYRNLKESDKEKEKRQYNYGGSGQKFAPELWKSAGRYMVGWGQKKDDSEKKYSFEGKINDSLIDSNSPELSLYGVWKYNSYTIKYDGNASDCTGKTASQKVSYEQTVTLATNGFKRENYKFIGWSLKAGSLEADYKQGKELKVSKLVEPLMLQDTNKGSITLYAVWDGPPAIEAYDLYFSRLEATAGKLTESFLGGFMRAYDLEDGEIKYGRNKKNSFLITNYNAKQIQGGPVQPMELMLEASDSKGEKTTKRIWLTLVDTSVHSEYTSKGHVRFISLSYYGDSKTGYLSVENGGLADNSCWRKDASYAKALALALQKTR